MARRNQSRRLPNRPRNLPLIGDPSPLPPAPYTDHAPEIAAQLFHNALMGQSIDEQLANMDDRELMRIALELGAKTTDLLGTKNCNEHYGMREMRGSIAKVNYATDVVWCLNCFAYYRY